MSRDPSLIRTRLGLTDAESAEVKTRVDAARLASDDAAIRETRSWEVRSGADSMSLVGETVGSYRITRVLGEGGVGTVYYGEHPLIGSRVAIKVLHEDFADSKLMVERFMQEARAANAIPSAHIVPVSDFGRLPDGRDYAVMEYLEGQPLDALLAPEGTLAIPRVAELLRQIAEGMEAAHATGILHRDLKPENIFIETNAVDGSEFVRIFDFGIAKLLDEESNARQTGVGAVLGTPLYCAPEQAAGKPVGPACDIYALGAIGYELLTGRPVFEGNVVEILVSKSTRNVTPIEQIRPEVPAAMAGLLHEMLARDPEGRPRSMKDVALRLAPIAGRVSAGAVPASPATPPPTEPLVAPPRAPLDTTAASQAVERATPAPPGRAQAHDRRRLWPIVVTALAAGLVGILLAALRPSAKPSNATAEPASAPTAQLPASVSISPTSAIPTDAPIPASSAAASASATAHDGAASGPRPRVPDGAPVSSAKPRSAGRPAQTAPRQGGAVAPVAKPKGGKLVNPFD